MTPHLLNRLRNQAWEIEPRYLESFLPSIEQASELRLRVGMEDSHNRNPLLQVSGDVGIVSMCGAMGKRLDSFERYMGMTDYDDIAEAIEDANGMDDVEKIVLSIDSPGGTVVGNQELADMVYANAKPIYAVTDCYMASAAYKIGSQAKAVFCTPSAMVGSIGTMMIRQDQTKFLEQLGVKVKAFFKGPRKADGHPFKPMSKDEEKELEAMIDQMHSKFVQTVERARKVDPVVFESRVYGAEEAVTLGLADGMVNNLSEVLALI